MRGGAAEAAPPGVPAPPAGRVPVVYVPSGHPGEDAVSVDRPPGRRPARGSADRRGAVYGREQLRQTLARIDGRPYPAYRDLTGAYAFGRFVLHVEHVQPDPYAPPSRLRAVFPAGESGLDPGDWRRRVRRVALEDWLLRRLHRALARAVGGPAQGGGAGDGDAGHLARQPSEDALPAACLHVMAPGQQVIERSAVMVRGGQIEVRLACALPAARRGVLGPRAAAALDVALPAALTAMLPVGPADAVSLAAHLALHEDQEALRDELRRRGWVAFLADGSILPRESGDSDLPLPVDQAVPLRAPEALAATVRLPHRGEIRGLPVAAGVTLVVGGAYHGKSTLLRALERGVYDHVAGDGRELCVCRDTAMSIAAEDGRPVSAVDISAFVHPLPGGADTRRFRTRSASGSTSQASALVEAIEGGADCLLLDEDRSAANFLSRDARMRALVLDAEDPVTPFADRVRALWEQAGVSTVAVVGGAGALLGAADRVLRMRDYLPEDATAAARAVCERIPAPAPAGGAEIARPAPRVPLPDAFPVVAYGAVRARPRGPRAIVWDERVIDLSAQAQLVDAGQVRVLADMLPRAAAYADGGRTLAQVAAEAFADVARLGLEAVSPWAGQCPGDYALPRPLELVAALNRLPGLRLAGDPPSVAAPRPRPAFRPRVLVRTERGGGFAARRGPDASGAEGARGVGRGQRVGSRPGPRGRDDPRQGPGGGRRRGEGGRPSTPAVSPNGTPAAGVRRPADAPPRGAPGRGRPLRPAAAALRTLTPRAAGSGPQGRAPAGAGKGGQEARRGTGRPPGPSPTPR